MQVIANELIRLEVVDFAAATLPATLNITLLEIPIMLPLPDTSWRKHRRNP